MTSSTLKRKPFAYLDHNILDHLIKHPNPELKQFITERFQVVYSDETLNEIARSTGFEEKFIIELESFDPVYIELQLTEKFRITDKIKWFKASPREVIEFKEKNREPEIENPVQAMQAFGLKMAGGLKGKTINEVIDEQQIHFDSLLNVVQKNATEAKLGELGIDISIVTEHLKKNYESAQGELKNKLGETIPNSESYRGPKENHQKIGIGPGVLNNINGSEVAKQIFELFLTFEDFKGANISIERFYGVDENRIYPGEAQTMFEKVIGMYSVLNTIGYFPDSDRHKERRFISSNSDANHAAMGIFCSATFSMDEAFCKKIRAIYEFLDIGNEVCYCTTSQK